MMNGLRILTMLLVVLLALGAGNAGAAAGGPEGEMFTGASAMDGGDDDNAGCDACAGEQQAVCTACADGHCPGLALTAPGVAPIAVVRPGQPRALRGAAAHDAAGPPDPSPPRDPMPI